MRVAGRDRRVDRPASDQGAAFDRIEGERVDSLVVGRPLVDERLDQPMRRFNYPILAVETELLAVWRAVDQPVSPADAKVHLAHHQIKVPRTPPAAQVFRLCVHPEHQLRRGFYQPAEDDDRLVTRDLDLEFAHDERRLVCSVSTYSSRRAKLASQNSRYVPSQSATSLSRPASNRHRFCFACRRRDTRPAASSTFRCLEIAGWLIGNGSAMSSTPASPDVSRERMARLVGSASAANALSSSSSGSTRITGRLYVCGVPGQVASAILLAS